MMAEIIEELLTPGIAPAKTYTQLIDEGTPHNGGLAQLAEVEQTEDPGPQLAALSVAGLGRTLKSR